MSTQAVSLCEINEFTFSFIHSSCCHQNKDTNWFYSFLFHYNPSSDPMVIKCCSVWKPVTVETDDGGVKVHRTILTLCQEALMKTSWIYGCVTNRAGWWSVVTCVDTELFWFWFLWFLPDWPSGCWSAPRTQCLCSSPEILHTDTPPVHKTLISKLSIMTLLSRQAQLFLTVLWFSCLTLSCQCLQLLMLSVSYVSCRIPALVISFFFVSML